MHTGWEQLCRTTAEIAADFCSRRGRKKTAHSHTTQSGLLRQCSQKGRESHGRYLGTCTRRWGRPRSPSSRTARRPPRPKLRLSQPTLLSIRHCEVTPSQPAGALLMVNFHFPSPIFSSSPAGGSHISLSRVSCRSESSNK